MTAGSIELFPIRVAPMARAPPPATIPSNPSLISKQRVCRSLFGRVEPGSVEIERRNEEQNKLEEWKRRYNVDLNKMKFNAVEEEKTTATTALPSLIEQELEEHQKRLASTKRVDDDDDHNEKKNENQNQYENEQKEEKCNSTIEKLRENSETTPQPHRSSSSSSISSNSNVKATTNLSTSGSKHRNHSHNGDLGCQSVNGTRCLPYARQKLISECFTTRRKPVSQHSLLDRQKHWSDLWEESSSASDALLLNTTATTETVSSSIKQQNKT